MWKCEVDGTDSELCPIVDFGIIEVWLPEGQFLRLFGLFSSYWAACKRGLIEMNFVFAVRKSSGYIFIHKSDKEEVMDFKTKSYETEISSLSCKETVCQSWSFLGWWSSFEGMTF